MLITKFLHNCLNEALQKLIDEQNITNFTPPLMLLKSQKIKLMVIMQLIFQCN